MNSSSLVVPQITQRISSSGVVTHEHESFIKPECIPESLDVATLDTLFPEILLYAPLCVAGAWVARKLRFPTAFMLGPMIVMCVVQLSTTMHTPSLPASLLNVMSMIIFLPDSMPKRVSI
ncbi:MULTISPECIES: AbrB family transcriptional regulator [Paenibacillus]|uniref:AbrB family transcriptional regulator n=1 Tax=Paenibacillus TaxID=44249 RepID=UPI000F52C18B|nr:MULTISPECIES: AbrB family transcriptional regulator [Paenibacillus]KAA8746228.1 AbrB family transcriptional regulator [Paenibacillus sp. UASWS1643]